MDRLIKTAWRAFWVGLGASAVLITQSLAAPTAPTEGPAPALAEPPPAPLLAPSIPAASRGPRHFDPALSTTPRCATVASVTRCS